MKKELIINQPGLFLRLTGVHPTRTPVKIDITKLNMTLLISELNMNGVIDYQIISKQNKDKKIKVVNKENMSVKELINNLKSNSENDDIKKDLNDIKSLLKDIMNKQPVIVEKNIYNDTSNNIESKKETKRRKKISDDFIPNVNIENLELKSSNIETITTDSDFSENVDLLSKMSKKKEK